MWQHVSLVLQDANAVLYELSGYDGASPEIREVCVRFSNCLLKQPIRLNYYI